MLSLGRETTYRVGSVGQDCQLLLWDFVITDEFAASAAAPGYRPQPQIGFTAI